MNTATTPWLDMFGNIALPGDLYEISDGAATLKIKEIHEGCIRASCGFHVGSRDFFRSSCTLYRRLGPAVPVGPNDFYAIRSTLAIMGPNFRADFSLKAERPLALQLTVDRLNTLRKMAADLKGGENLPPNSCLFVRDCI